LTAVVPAANIEEAWQEVGASFERFCLTAGLATLSSMMEEDAVIGLPAIKRKKNVSRAN
jgi:hypothetical protein